MAVLSTAFGLKTWLYAQVEETSLSLFSVPSLFLFFKYSVSLDFFYNNNLLVSFNLL